MKRYIKRWISFILFMCVFVQYPSEGVVMAADSDQKNIQIVGTASMNTYDVVLRVGKTKQLVCNGTTGKMVWKSSNPKVATVDKKGLVKAIKPGKAMISVSGGNLIGSMTCKVGVSKKITTKQARRKIMAMKKKILYTAYALLFLIICAVPAALMPFVKAEDTKENRKLSQFPEIKKEDREAGSLVTFPIVKCQKVYLPKSNKKVIRTFAYLRKSKRILRDSTTF